jgi:hypothetical protein
LESLFLENLEIIRQSSLSDLPKWFQPRLRHSFENLPQVILWKDIIAESSLQIQLIISDDLPQVESFHNFLENNGLLLAFGEPLVSEHLRWSGPHVGIDLDHFPDEFFGAIRNIFPNA